jgi:hypothetical protein
MTSKFPKPESVIRNGTNQALGYAEGPYAFKPEADYDKSAVPDLTTTVLTLTITGFAADSSLARGTNPRLQRRIAALVAMIAGAVLGSITIRHSVMMAPALSVVLAANQT